MSLLTRPKSVKELSAGAENKDFQKVTRDSLAADVKVVLRTARNLLMQADMLLEDEQTDENLDRAYVLHMRYAQFILTYLPKHRDYASIPSKQRHDLLQAVNGHVMDTITRLHGLVKHRTQVYEKQAADARRRREEGKVSLPVSSPTSAKKERDPVDLADIMKGLQTMKENPPPPSRPPAVYVRQYSYPAIPTTAADLSTAREGRIAISQLPSHSPPPLPRKPSLTGSTFPPAPPLLPPKETIHEEAAGTDRFSYAIRASTEGGQDLRTIYVPKTLRERFLKIAYTNTSRNLETCGVLCGILKQNALFITTLVIPAQESTSDTCATTDEEALFEFQDSRNLLTLGWIHTHPSQTCFLSSLDMHTHCSYQLMLAEAVAIVCSPRQTPSYGIFRLTDPPGKQAIMACTQQGLFHPHAEPNIYTGATRDEQGHVLEYDKDFEVADIR